MPIFRLSLESSRMARQLRNSCNEWSVIGLRVRLPCHCEASETPAHVLNAIRKRTESFLSAQAVSPKKCLKLNVLKSTSAFVRWSYVMLRISSTLFFFMFLRVDWENQSRINFFFVNVEQHCQNLLAILLNNNFAEHLQK